MEELESAHGRKQKDKLILAEEIVYRILHN